MDNIPIWLADLSPDDIGFIRNFVLASGSLRELEKIYGVSYPTIRNRLDQLIQKIKVSGEKEDNSYVRLIQRLAIEDKIEFSAANLLIRKYREEKNQ